MIVENSKFKKNNVYRVIRICDECGERGEQCLQSVKRGRKIRGGEIDLCRRCAYLSKYAKKKPIRGKKHHSWKHGLQGGYKRITLEDGRRIREHRYIYEKHIGREIVSKERVHHIDFNRLNNDISNLILFENNGEHRKCHMISMEKCALEFLNSKMWFDFRTNKYTLEYDEDFCERNNIEIDLSIFGKKVGIKYPKYKVERKDGTFQERKCYIVIIEHLLKRRLCYGEVVHHIDGDNLNNNPNNLVMLNRKIHASAHYSLQLCTAELLKIGSVGFNREKKEYFVKS